MNKALRNIFTILATSFTFAGCGIPQKPPSAGAEPAKSKAESSRVIPYDKAATTGVDVAELNEIFKKKVSLPDSLNNFTLVIEMESAGGLSGSMQFGDKKSPLSYGEGVEKLIQYIGKRGWVGCVSGFLYNTDSEGPSYALKYSKGHVEESINVRQIRERNIPVTFSP